MFRISVRSGVRMQLRCEFRNANWPNPDVSWARWAVKSRWTTNALGKTAAERAIFRWKHGLRLVDNPDRAELRERYRDLVPPGPAGLRFERFALAVREESVQ